MSQDDMTVAKAPASGSKRKRTTKKDALKDAGDAKANHPGSEEEEEEPAKKEPAHAKGGPKPVKSAAIVKSDNEDEEAGDAVAKVEAKPAKKRGPAKSKAKTTSAATDVEEAEEAPAAITKKAAKTKPTATKKSTKKDAPTVEAKNLKQGTEGAKKPAAAPIMIDGDEGDDEKEEE